MGSPTHVMPAFTASAMLRWCARRCANVCNKNIAEFSAMKKQQRVVLRMIFRGHRLHQSSTAHRENRKKSVLRRIGVKNTSVVQCELLQQHLMMGIKIY